MRGGVALSTPLASETKGTVFCVVHSYLFIVKQQVPSASWKIFNGFIYLFISNTSNLVFLKELESKQPENLEFEGFEKTFSLSE